MSEPFVWTDAEVRTAVGVARPGSEGSEAVGAAHPTHRYSGVTTDSRAAAPGQLYVALVGERFDGHDFVADALAAGALAAVVSRPVAGVDEERLFVVPDTLVALGRLARHRRRALPARVVAIAGSAGKTSTKQLTQAALGTGLRVHATRANLNNRIGVPLTLLEAPEDAEAVVVELGTSLRGEVAQLAKIVEADLAVIVTVGPEHLEGIGELADAIDEELDLLRSLRPEGLAVVGDTPGELADRARELCADVRVAGLSGRADTELRPQALVLDAAGRAQCTWQGHTVHFATAGRHAVGNAMLALAVARAFDLEERTGLQAVAEVEPTALRGETRTVDGLTLVLDCYNANPQSVRAALDLLEAHQGRGRVAVLGSMLELGLRSDAWHDEVLADALARDLDHLVLTGEFAAAAQRCDVPSTVLVCADPADAVARLAPSLTGTEVVLLKASRSVALERLVPLFEAAFAAGERA